MPRSGLLDCYDIDDMKARMITTDTSASLVYGQILKNVGIQEMSLEVVMTESESYGDGQVLDQFSRAKLVQGSFKNAWVTHDFLAAVLAGQSRQSGSSPNEKLETAFGSVNLPFFELDFQCKYVGPIGSLAGDAHEIIHKCKMTKWSLGKKSESRQEISGEFKGIPLINKEAGWNFPRCFTLVENETASILTPGAADVTAPTISSFTPTAAQASVPVASSLTWTFSEALDPTSVNEEHFLLATAAGVYVTFASISLNAAGTVVTAVPASNLTASTQHRWTVTRGVRDRAGNRLAAAQTNTFTTV
jgi:hypothetical protein